jgi:hypothetical protein
LSMILKQNRSTSTSSPPHLASRAIKFDTHRRETGLDCPRYIASGHFQPCRFNHLQIMYLQSRRKFRHDLSVKSLHLYPARISP